MVKRKSKWDIEIEEGYVFVPMIMQVEALDKKSAEGIVRDCLQAELDAFKFKAKKVK